MCAQDERRAALEADLEGMRQALFALGLDWCCSCQQWVAARLMLDAATH